MPGADIGLHFLRDFLAAFGAGQLTQQGQEGHQLLVGHFIAGRSLLRLGKDHALGFVDQLAVAVNVELVAHDVGLAVHHSPHSGLSLAHHFHGAGAVGIHGQGDFHAVHVSLPGAEVGFALGADGHGFGHVVAFIVAVVGRQIAVAAEDLEDALVVGDDQDAVFQGDGKPAPGTLGDDSRAVHNIPGIGVHPAVEGIGMGQGAVVDEGQLVVNVVVPVAQQLVSTFDDGLFHIGGQNDLLIAHLQDDVAGTVEGHLSGLIHGFAYIGSAIISVPAQSVGFLAGFHGRSGAVLVQGQGHGAISGLPSAHEILTVAQVKFRPGRLRTGRSRINLAILLTDRRSVEEVNHQSAILVNIGHSIG